MNDDQLLRFCQQLTYLWTVEKALGAGAAALFTPMARAGFRLSGEPAEAFAKWTAAAPAGEAFSGWCALAVDEAAGCTVGLRAGLVLGHPRQGDYLCRVRYEVQSSQVPSSPRPGVSAVVEKALEPGLVNWHMQPDPLKTIGDFLERERFLTQLDHPVLAREVVADFLQRWEP